MPERVVIKEVWGSADHFTVGDGVNLIAYNLTLEDGRKARINQKPETDPPTVGLVLEAEVLPPAEGKKMWKIKGAKRLSHEFDYSRPQGAVQASLQPVGRFEVQDVTQRLIIRQNALNRALECAVAMNRCAPELSISEGAQIWVDFFEQLIWEAATPGHEQKVLEWAGVLEEAPAGGEGMSEGHPPIPPSDVTEASPPAGAGPPAEGHITGIPQSVPAPEREADPPGGSPREGGDVSTASPATLVQIQRLRRERNVPPLVFSTFLTSMGVEDISHLSEDDAQVVIAWIANGDGAVAA